ncbi:MAG: baseplate J/gp47 family protein [Anaerolineales bacterium]
MNTFLIELQEHDDRISLRDRLNWAKTRRILLLWPSHRRVSLTTSDLKFLQHHARRLGAQLGLVTGRADVRITAQALGIPVFANTRQAQRSTWRASLFPKHSHRQIVRPARPKKDSLSPIWRLFFFSLAVLAVFSLVMLFLPRASVVLTPRSLTQREIFALAASSQGTTVSLQGELPLLPIDVEVEADEHLQATRRFSVPLAKAQGVARFTNLTTRSQTIPAGTVVYVPGDPPIRFLTLNTAGLPPNAGQFVDVPIEAIAAGSGGNVPAQAIQAIEGPLAFSLSVTNPQATQGGREEERLAVTPQEVEQLREELSARLREQALQEARRRLNADDILFPQTLQLMEILEERAVPPVEAYPSRLSLHLRLRFRVWSLSAERLRPLLVARLDALLPEGVRPRNETLRMRLRPESVEVFREGDSPLRLRFSLEAQRTLSAKIASEQVLAALRGRPVGEALKGLRALPLAEPPQLKLWPSFWPWMPLLPVQVSIEFVP